LLKYDETELSGIQFVDMVCVDRGNEEDAVSDEFAVMRSIMLTKAPSTPATCQNYIRLCRNIIQLFEAAFNFVAKNDNNVEQVYHEISSFDNVAIFVSGINVERAFFAKFRPFDKVRTN